MTRYTLRHYQQLLSPGTALRTGIDRILHGRTGALVVLGNNPAVRRISTGGFHLDVEFTPQALRELAKMDGAIVLSNDLTRIVAAAVHLVPPGDLPTAETGTRHRTADRTSQVADVPTVTVSASMSTVSLFVDGNRHHLEATGDMLVRADQTLATLSRFTARLDQMVRQFTALEVADQVRLHDLVQVAQRYETTRRLAAEAQFHIDTLGLEGRLVALQLAELMAEFTGLPESLAEDYSHHVPAPEQFGFEQLHNFSADELMSSTLVAERLGFGSQTFGDTPIHPRGIRVLNRVGRLPAGLVGKLVDTFSLQELFGASAAELTALDGIGETRARQVREALMRINDATFAHTDSGLGPSY
ncbi:MAG: DNA integrity scanning diadenylate cyclase DisA [Arachnia sp.]